jgi:cytochrome bd-type quinol oxidase subunit 2
MSGLAAAAPASSHTRGRGISPALRFVGHYLEMVAVMLLGMVALGGAALGLLALAGVTSEELSDDAPALYLIGMGISMVVPMVWWMRHRGHSAAANREMAAAMIVPTLAVLVLLAAGAFTDVHSLMGIQHATMFPAMFGVMLLRTSTRTAHTEPASRRASRRARDRARSRATPRPSAGTPPGG